MREPFEIEPEDLAKALVLLELDGIIWDGNAGAHHHLDQHAGELRRALASAGYRGPELVAGTHVFDGPHGQVRWMFNPERFNASSAKAWVTRQVNAPARGA